MPPPVEGEAAVVPVAGQVVGMVLALAATTTLTLFLTNRTTAIRSWRRLPLAVWLVFAIYVDSYVFVSATAMLQFVFGVSSNLTSCDGAILLCLVCYVTTKFIYLFLVEKAHIIRRTPKGRLRSRLYLFNSFGMLGVYVIVVLLNFVFRFADFRNGVCYIGMKKLALIPLISFDTIVNIYLTVLFLIPLWRLYSFKHMPRTRASRRLRDVALRTFVGAACTLLSSIANLSILMVLGGEPGWLCLTSCNFDILFSAIVIQCITSRDHAGASETSSSYTGVARRREGRGPSSASAPTTRGLLTISTMGTNVSLVSMADPNLSYRDFVTDGLGDPASPVSAAMTTVAGHERGAGARPADVEDAEDGGLNGEGEAAARPRCLSFAL